MLPDFSQDNLTYMILGNAKRLPNFFLGHALRGQRTNLEHLGCCEFRCSTQFAKQAAWVVISALRNHIVAIVLVRAKKEVVRIDAGAHIATMKHAQVIWDKIKVKFPRQAMSADASLIHTNYSISVGSEASAPKPTFVRRAYSNVLPESLGNGAASATVSTDIAIWFAFDDSATLVVKGSDTRLLSTATSAVAKRCFIEGKLGLNKLWGMICHVVSASNAIGQARELQLAWHFLLADYSCNYSTEVAF